MTNIRLNNGQIREFNLTKRYSFIVTHHSALAS